ncbi:MAG: DUF3333 domain-containing protein, partial [Thalassolituus sp.]
LVKNHFKEMVQPDGRKERRQLYSLISAGAGWQIQEAVMNNPRLIGKTLNIALIMDDDVDQWLKHERGEENSNNRLSEKQLEWLESWVESGALHTRFNTTFFVNGDSREPELAGIRGAITGTLLTLLVTFLLSFPIGVAAAIYLEEFAPKNRLTEFVEIIINYLAAVPSITFGLLGLAIFMFLVGVSR